MTRTLISLLALALLTVFSAGAQQAPKKPLRRAPAPPPLVLPPAGGEQFAAAALTYFGDYACEFNQSLQISLNPRFDGYVDVRFGKQLHTMKPTLSSTGAIRLEDVRGRLLLVQIAQKSMLLDVKAGHRLVDDCVHEKQAENRNTIAAAPPQPGLGIAPVVATDTAPAAASEASASAPAPAPEPTGTPAVTPLDAAPASPPATVPPAASAPAASAGVGP
jgi:hypothetical protein